MGRVIMIGLLALAAGAAWLGGAGDRVAVPGVLAHARTGYAVGTGPAAGALAQDWNARGANVRGQAAAADFPDVPPWHWAHDGVQKDHDVGIVIGYPASGPELILNAVFQVYDGFAHAGVPAAQAWVERFTYNRPASWPQPLQQSRIVRFALQDPRASLGNDTATARFMAVVTTRQGREVTAMRVALRRTGEDWQVDYASLAAGSALFR